jgi:hypothetical protein
LRFLAGKLTARGDFQPSALRPGPLEQLLHAGVGGEFRRKVLQVVNLLCTFGQGAP